MLLAEDETLLANAMPALLLGASRGHIACVRTVKTRYEMFHALRAERVDVLLCDLKMPNRDGDAPTPLDTQTLERIRRVVSGVAIMIFSSSPGTAIAQLLLDAGADGLLDKAILPCHLCHAIERVAQGGKYVEPRIEAAMHLLSIETTKASLREQLLEGRRGEVLLLLLEGLSPSEIAESLSLGKKYVDRLIRQIKTITGVATHIRILRVCVELGIAKL